MPGKNKQNAVKTMVVTDDDGRLLFCSPTKPGSCADTTHARQLGLVAILADGPAVEILADAGYQGLGAQTGGRVITPPHRKFKKEMVMSLAAKGLTIASCRRSCPSDRAGHIRGGR
ncbi:MULTISPECIES: transposase family protein [Streptomyces]|uniref:transposase family protein n=2 Tax=Streptomyces TaxID=1883 RepID=UPI00315CFAB5